MVGRALVRRGLQRAGLDKAKKVRYGVFNSGDDQFGGAVLDVLGPAMQYMFAVEGVRLAAFAHAAGWYQHVRAAGGKAFAESTDLSILPELQAFRVDVVGYSFLCSPWSPITNVQHPPGTRVRTEMLRTAVETIQAELQLVMQVGAKLIVMEGSEHMLDDKFAHWWRQVQGLLGRYEGGYQIDMQLLCPRRDFGQLAPRLRLFIVAVAK